MKKYARAFGELLLFGVLAGLLLVAVVVITRYVFDDKKVQYFVIGYYVAMHNNLARWIWKRLRITRCHACREIAAAKTVRSIGVPCRSKHHACKNVYQSVS